MSISEYWQFATCCFGGAMVFVGVFLIMLLGEHYKEWKARNWPTAMGTVVVSEVRMRMLSSSNSPTKYDNQPFVSYEYQAGGRSYYSTRIGFSAGYTGDEIDPILARYPVGKTVTVYYNPNRPDQSVLEKNLPKSKLYLGVLIFSGVMLCPAIFAPIGLYALASEIAPLLPDPTRAAMTVALFGGGLFALILAYSVNNQVRLAKKHWHSTQGTIISSNLDSYKQFVSTRQSYGRRTTMYRPSIVYEFEINGRTYHNDKIRIGATTTASMSSIFKKQLDAYSPGSHVTVYFDPQDPNQSALELKGEGNTAFLLFAIAWFALAFWVSGLWGRL